MATYTEIDSNKTVTLDATSGTKTLTYYAGNKSISGSTTGTIVGNVDKKTITHVFDGTSTWINSVTLSNRDDTAKNITVNYQANNSTSARQVNLKLKDQTSAFYLILRLSAGSGPTPPEPDETKYEYKFIINVYPSQPSQNTVYLYKVYCEENVNLFVWVVFLWCVSDAHEWNATKCAVQFDETDYITLLNVPLTELFEGYVFTNRNHYNYSTLYNNGHKYTPLTTTYSLLLTDSEASCFIFEGDSYAITEETSDYINGDCDVHVNTTDKTITISANIASY